MEEAWLRSQLESGRSIEAMAREVGRDPSTVAYWVNKYGLASQHAARARPRGPLDRTELAALVEQGMTIRQIAAALDRSTATVRHWLGRYGLRTRPPQYLRRDAEQRTSNVRECARHGWTAFFEVGASGQHRCRLCNRESVIRRRRALKALLVREAGGCCALCGYDRYVGALHFHHLDPLAKSFTIAGRGLTQSLAAVRDEAAKCVLLCGNCHAEVEGGVATIAPSGPADRLL
jgi:transposase-like protein